MALGVPEDTRAGDVRLVVMYRPPVGHVDRGDAYLLQLASTRVLNDGEVQQRLDSMVADLIALADPSTDALPPWDEAMAAAFREYLVPLRDG